MNELNIDELKAIVANAKTSLEQYLALELIKLKGEQVPVAWTSQRSLETKNKIVAFTDDMSALDYGVANGWTDIVELFTAPQKPVVLPKIRDSKYWGGVEFRCDKYQLDVQAAIEAAGGFVKDGE